MKINLIHDSLTQRGGAERVVQAISQEISDVKIYTFGYDEFNTLEGFKRENIVDLNEFRVVSNSRLSTLASAFYHANSVEIPYADLNIVSSSGLAHHVKPIENSILYFHSPARWLHYPDQYGIRFKRLFDVLLSPIKTKDLQSVHAYTKIAANSIKTQQRIKTLYGLTVPVVHPPLGLIASPVPILNPCIDHQFVLHVARPRKYKNHKFVEAVAELCPEITFVFVGTTTSSTRAPNCVYLQSLSDGQLNWLYAKASILLAVAEEDYGLTPIEAGRFGTPTMAISKGGYLETIVPEKTGWLIDELNPKEFAKEIRNNISYVEQRRPEVMENTKSISAKEFIEELMDIARD